jgi:hypothetical protein
MKVLFALVALVLLSFVNLQVESASSTITPHPNGVIQITKEFAFVITDPAPEAARPTVVSGYFVVERDGRRLELRPQLPPLEAMPVKSN